MQDVAIPVGGSRQPEALFDGGHSAYQIEHFITTRGNWTPWGKLQQALREVRTRRRARAQLCSEIELAQIERIETRREWCFRETSRRRRAIRLRRLDERIDELTECLAANGRALVQFQREARSAALEVGPVSSERRAALERETWNVRIRAMAAIDVHARGSLSPATLELLCAIPSVEREAIFTEIRTGLEAGRENPQQLLLAWLDEAHGVSEVAEEGERSGPEARPGNQLPTFEPRSRGN
jgi:hypothetical protein